MQQQALILLLSLAIIFGAGCVPRYILGEIPTEAQLARMTQAEKQLGMQAVVKKDPLPELTPEQREAEGLRSIEVQSKGQLERIAEFTSEEAQLPQGKAIIVKSGEVYSLVLTPDFEISPGPRLSVILSSHLNPTTDAELLAASKIELGPLKSVDGVQTYDLPISSDISSVRSVVIYSAPFKTILAVASIQ